MSGYEGSNVIAELCWFFRQAKTRNMTSKWPSPVIAEANLHSDTGLGEHGILTSKITKEVLAANKQVLDTCLLQPGKDSRRRKLKSGIFSAQVSVLYNMQIHIFYSRDY
jgi:hypothetical protein